MNSFELNKIMGAVLGTLLFVMGVGFLAEAIYHPIENRGVGYALPEPEIGEAAGAAQEEEQAVPLPNLLAQASAETGASAVRKCQSCHTFEEGGANAVGPNLYAVVGRPIASHEGYSYSDALAEHSGENWTYQNLFDFLHGPQDFAPGNKMPLAVPDEAERADILAYLQTLDAEPVPFPDPVEVTEEASTEAAPEDGAAEEQGDSLSSLLAQANAETGASTVRKCQSCHTFEEGGPNTVGPNLYDVVGRPIASHEGYSYSDALAEHSDETWTYQNLFDFLHAPQEFAPGNKMPLAVPDEAERADILAYLQTLAAEPVPFPGSEGVTEEDVEASAEPMPEGEAVVEPAEPAETENVISTPEGTEEPPLEETSPATPAADEGGDAAAAGGEGSAELIGLLAQTDAETGAQTARRCQACHTFEEGGANRVGPNLYDVVGRPIASLDSFAYSDALAGRSDETWTYQNLFDFLHAPQEFASGTSMTMAVPQPEDRASILAYLQTLSAEPVPFPTGTASEGEASADTEADAAGETTDANATEGASEEEAPAEDAAAPTEGDDGSGIPVLAEDAAASAESGDATAAGEASTELVGLMAAADAETGAQTARRCQACHTFEEGGANRVGPNLYGVVGRSIASLDNFAYSDALAGRSDETWTYQNLFNFLHAPQEFAPGTNMMMAVPQAEERADILAYLQTLAAEPVPLPE